MRKARWIVFALALLILADSSAGSWGPGRCNGQSFQFGTPAVRTTTSKAKKKKATKPAPNPPAAEGGINTAPVCEPDCKCDCIDVDDCPCYKGAHCGCTSCPCGLTKAARTAQSKGKPPVTAKQAREQWDRYGVQRHKLHTGQRYKIGETPATRAQVIARLTETLADDSAKLPLTVIGPGREQVVKDIAEHPAFAGIRDGLLVQAYNPGSWAVAKYGFATDGQPSIYLQQKEGPVLLRRADYAGGAELLASQVATAVGRLRRADPKYKKEKDPDGRLPIAGLDIPAPIIGLGAVVAVLAVGTFLSRRKDT